MSWLEIPHDSRRTIRVPSNDLAQDELLELVEHAALANVAIADLASVGAILALEDAFDVVALPDTVPESVVEHLRELLLAQGARR
jgi:hypothetical protein